jgi:LPS sulfotransferase NodH
MSSEPAVRRKPYDLTTEVHDYPDWRGAPRRTVLLCSHPRSGSTLLGEALFFAGGQGCPLEYFHGGFRPGLAEQWGTHTLAEHAGEVHRRRTDPSGTLGVKLFWRDIAHMAMELESARFGSDFDKVMPEDLTPEDYRYIAGLLDPFFPHASYIHLWRRDRVRLAVSSITAAQTGLWREIPDMGQQPASGVAEYDFRRIDALVAMADGCHAHWRNYFAAIGAAPYELTYEQLSGDYSGSVRALLDHLGSAAEVPPIRMRRQSDSGNEAFVLRYLRERVARG